MTAWATEAVGALVASGEVSLQTGPFGTQLHARDYVDVGTPVINVRNIGFGAVRPAKLEYVSSATKERLRSHVLLKGDVVFGRKGAVERHVFIREGQDGWLQGSDCIRLRFTSTRVLPQFASYFFLTPQHQQWMMNQCSHAATMASLNQAILERIVLPIPTLRTQRAVVEMLAAYDDLIENCERRIVVLDQMVGLLYRELFVSFRYPGHQAVPLVESQFGSLPKGWRPQSLELIARVYRGRSYRTSDLADQGGVPFVNLKCIDRDGGFRRSGIKRFVGLRPELHAVRHGDIVVAVTDMTQERRIVARAALVPALDGGFGVVSMDLVRLEAIQPFPSQWLYAYLRYSSFADHLKQHANGANVLHLSPDLIRAHVLPAPNPAVAAEFAARIRPALEMRDVLEDRIGNIRTTRDLLVPQILSGRLPIEVAA